MTEGRTNLRVYAIVSVAEDRSGDPDSWVTVRKIVYTREAADAAIEKLTAKGEGKRYFWQLTSIEPMG